MRREVLERKDHKEMLALKVQREAKVRKDRKELKERLERGSHSVERTTTGRSIM